MDSLITSLTDLTGKWAGYVWGIPSIILFVGTGRAFILPSACALYNFGDSDTLFSSHWEQQGHGLWGSAWFMALPNLISVILLAKLMKQLGDDYFNRMKSVE